MAWKPRKGKRYFYHSYRGADGKPRKVYAGRGSVAERIAEALGQQQASRLDNRIRARNLAERYAAALAPLQELIQLSRQLVTTRMSTLGFHRHDRGHWRKKRMSDPTPPNPVEYPPTVHAAFERAAAGDRDALPEVRKAFDTYPELLAYFDDLAKVAHQSLLTLISGNDHLAAESARRQALARRETLLAECESDVEKLLAERLVLCEVEVHVAIIQAAQFARQEPGSPTATTSARRVDQAHARLMSAARALADVRRALRPTRSPMDFVAGTTSEGPILRNRVRNRVGTPAPQPKCVGAN